MRSCGASTRLPRVSVDMHLGPGLPRHPGRARRAPRSRLLLGRRRARRRRRGDDHLRAGGDAGARALRAPRARRRRRRLQRRRPARTPACVDGACIFLNRPGLRRRRGLRAAPRRARRRRVADRLEAVGLLAAPDQGRLGAADDDGGEVATVRRWTRADWGDEGETMAWCCTEGDRAYVGDRAGHRVARRRDRGDRRHGRLRRAAPPPRSLMVTSGIVGSAVSRFWPVVSM